MCITDTLSSSPLVLYEPSTTVTPMTAAVSLTGSSIVRSSTVANPIYSRAVSQDAGILPGSSSYAAVTLRSGAEFRLRHPRPAETG